MTYNLTYNNTKWIFELSEGDYAFMAFEIIVGLAAVLGNTFTVVAFARFYFLQTITNKFVVSLAISDIVVGLVGLYDSMYWLHPSLEDSKVTCFLVIYLKCVTFMVSTNSLMAIAIDRYVAILHPLRYSSLMTSKRSTIAIFSLWTWCIFGGSLIFYWNRWDQTPLWMACLYPIIAAPDSITVSVVFGFVIQVVVIISLYAIIFREVYRHKRQIQSLVPDRNNASTIKKEKNTSFTLAIVVGTFLICWTPNMIVLLLASVDSRLYDDNLYFITMIFTVFNSCVNPIIYGWKNKSFKRAFRKMVHLKSRAEDTDI